MFRPPFIRDKSDDRAIQILLHCIYRITNTKKQPDDCDQDQKPDIKLIRHPVPPFRLIFSAGHGFYMFLTAIVSSTASTRSRSKKTPEITAEMIISVLRSFLFGCSSGVLTNRTRLMINHAKTANTGKKNIRSCNNNSRYVFMTSVLPPIQFFDLIREFRIAAI